MVTLVTQSSVDRFPQLKAQAHAYANAPLSIAIYAPFESTTSTHREEEVLQSIQRLHEELAVEGARRVTISVRFGNARLKKDYDTTYPINELRNVYTSSPTHELTYKTCQSHQPLPSPPDLPSPLDLPSCCSFSSSLAPRLP